jgi:protein tyrosine phosphatase (PTP) superfamily phosphohydrolase (DUF442 family)
MQDPAYIHNWRRLTRQITTSGQPSEAELGTIRALGVTHIINLGLHSHERALPDEAATVRALGMTYIHIPVDFARPTEDDFTAFCEALMGLDDTSVHVHCIVNARVSAFFYRYRRDMLGVDDAVARQALETVWRPGGVWAAFIGDADAVTSPHRYAARDY